MAFNLSKNNDPAPEPPKNGWVFILLAVIVLGAAVWYFIPGKEPAAMEAAAPVTPATEPAAPVTGAVPASSSDTTIAGGNAPSLIAASFNKGTSAPLSISDEVVNKIRQSEKITVYGYASSEGDLAVNHKLAQERAASFKQYLVSKGVDPKKITTVGKGIDNPVASNDTEAGRTRNRRVEVSIE